MTLQELIDAENWAGYLERIHTSQGLIEVREKNEDGDLPLHQLLGKCVYHDHKDVIKETMAAYTQALMEVGSVKYLGRGLPLHVALEYHSGRIPTDLIKLMVELAPESLRLVSFCCHDCLPLQLTAKHWKPSDELSFMDLFKFIYEAYPEAIKHKSTYPNQSFLYLACERFRHEHVDDIIRFLVEHDPESTKVDFFFVYPIHLACQNASVSREVLELLHQCHPEALLVKGIWGSPMQSVFHANKKEFSEQGARFILEKHPNIVREKSEDGQLPLHAVCSDFAKIPSSLALDILKAYPQAAREFDDHGNIPYHYILRPESDAKADDPFVVALLKEYPEAARQVNKEGQTELHIIAKGVADDGINLDFALGTINEKPQDAKVKDVHGKLPLHYICENLSRENAAFAVAILAAYPEAAGEGPLLPLQMCLLRADNISADFGIALLEAYPAAAKVKSRDDMLPLQIVCSYCWPVDSSFATNLLERNPDAAKEKDNRGRLPLHHLCKSCRIFSEAFATALLISNDDATKERDSWGMLPLHYICLNAKAESSDMLAAKLLEAYPAAAAEGDRYGRLPFHYIPRKGEEGDGSYDDFDDFGERSWNEEAFVAAIEAAYPAAADFKFDVEADLQVLKDEYGAPCFTWTLGPPLEDGSPDDILMDRVGGNTGFATYKDVANEWPCGGDLFFVCQIYLGNVPQKMASIVGNDGLLQIFQASSDWWEGSFVRVIPSEDFSSLVPCTALPDEEYGCLGQAPKMFPIVGWKEHVDFPYSLGEGSEDDEEYHHARSVLNVGSTAEHLWIHKFGGYGSYRQGDGFLRDCEHCGRRHSTQVQFQLVQESEGDDKTAFPKWLPFGDSGTVQYYWCPETGVSKSLRTEGSCY